jgi:hypothetical protein
VRASLGEDVVQNVDRTCGKLLTQWRHEVETGWLKDVPTHPLQQAG